METGAGLDTFWSVNYNTKPDVDYKVEVTSKLMNSTWQIFTQYMKITDVLLDLYTKYKVIIK